MVKFLDLHSQYLSIKDDIDHVIHDVIKNSAYIGGHYLNKFEKEFSNFIGTKFCIGVGNGTDALEIAINSLDLPKESEIIVPANSFIATSEAVTRNGHKVVFCDVDADSYTINFETIEQFVSKKTSAIIAVHLYGQPCNINDLVSFAKKNNLKIIEDCAQAHGAQYQGKNVGTFGDIAAFSFYPGKILGAYGDAGAILTNNNELENNCRLYANHGRTTKYNHIAEGRNSRLDSLQAAILSVKLKHLKKWIAIRRYVAEKYNQQLNLCNKIKLPGLIDDTCHAYHLYVIQSDNRKDLINYLADKNIDTGIHYPLTLPSLKAYSYYKGYPGCPVAEGLSAKILSLPIGEHMTDDMIETVISALLDYEITA